MADTQQKYGTSNQTITVTLASLTNNSARQSSEIDNSTNLFANAIVTAKVRTGASGTSTTGYVNVYAAGTADGGTTYADGASASDAAISLPTVPNSVLVARIAVGANATTYTSVFDIASAFGGVLPAKWVLIFQNVTGGTLDSTAGNFSVHYQGVFYQTN